MKDLPSQQMQLHQILVVKLFDHREAALHFEGHKLQVALCSAKDDDLVGVGTLVGDDVLPLQQEVLILLRVQLREALPQLDFELLFHGESEVV